MPKSKDVEAMEAVLDEAIAESFPASDPASSNAGERIGQPKRKPADEGMPKRRRSERS